MNRILSLTLAAAAVCALISASATTFYVDGSVSSSGDGKTWETALKTIQEGIDAAWDGDTVIVAKGTYVENIHFEENIVLTSTDPLDPSVVAGTIIDGNQSGPVVTFAGAESEACLLCGFTIQHGNAESGGGIAGRGTHATIQCNQITANSAYGGYARGGGGLADCHGIIEGNGITGNSASYGGGMLSCDGTIRNNTITGNEASWGAGLIWCEGIIENNILTMNAAAYGGGLHSCDGPISRNTIAGNSATARGGGLFDCVGLVEGNEVTHNAAGDGGGLAGCEGSVQGNTIAYNVADEEGGGLWWCGGVTANCIIWGNVAADGAQLHDCSAPAYCCIQDWSGGQDNIDLAPQFADWDGPDDDPETYLDNDYRLLPVSPCIDAGDNSALVPPGLDLDGNLRIAFGRTSLTVDMGAYECNSRPFQITSVTKQNGGLLLIWSSQPNDNYGVWSCLDVSRPTWVEEVTLPSEGETSVCSVIPTTEMRFYRVEMK